MKIDKADNRDKKRNKAKNGMRISGRSVFIIQKAIIQRSDKPNQPQKKRGKHKKK